MRIRTWKLSWSSKIIHFFSASDRRGNYEIKNVPLGKLAVEIWHPGFPTRRDTIEIVRDGQVFALNIDLKK